MFITGCQLFSIYISAFTLLRALTGPLSFILSVTFIEGIKIIFVFNMATLNCSYIIHFLIIFHFDRVNMISDGKVKLLVYLVGIISILPNILYISMVMKGLKVDLAAKIPLFRKLTVASPSLQGVQCPWHSEGVNSTISWGKEVLSGQIFPFTFRQEFLHSYF